MPSHRPSTVARPAVVCFEAAVRGLRYHGCPNGFRFGRRRCFGSSAATPDSNEAAAEDSLTVLTTNPNVDVNSLENTLKAHRDVNRAPSIRKIRGIGQSAQIRDPEIGIPAEKVKVPQKAGQFKRIALDKFTAARGTSRDLDALWKIHDTDKNPPLQYRLPWLRHLENERGVSHASAADRLAAEIRAFEKYFTPTQEEQHVAEGAINDLVATVKDIDATYVVDVIGSRSTNLAEPLSDIDLNICPPKKSDTTKLFETDAQVLILNKLHRALRNSSSKSKSSAPARFDVQYFVKHARVPILLCSHQASGLAVQVQCTPRTEDSREHVKAALKEFPSLRSLFKVLKQALQMRGLTVGSCGGITSYPLLQMIVAALKLSEARFHPNDVANHFLHFLEFYSDIDFSMYGISTEPLELFSKRSATERASEHGTEQSTKRRKRRGQSHSKEQGTFKGRIQNRTIEGDRYLMTLQDPANPVNDLGKSCYRINDVQETLIAIRATMLRSMATWDSHSAANRSDQSPGVRSLLEPCIGGDYRVYEYERDDLRILGRKTMDTG
jgi:DNA polymerase sigma